MANTVEEAAYIIEELSELADAIPHVCECCVGCELEKKNGGCDHAFILSPKRAIQYLIKSKWIPITERLPSREGRYITAFSNGEVGENVFLIFRDSHTKWYYNSEDTGEVTHWMPLPEPPKEE